MILKYFKRKLTLTKPSEREILLFDKKSYVFSNYLNKYNYSYLDLSKEINMYILLKLIFKMKKLSTTNYLIEYISCVNPKILISFIDNNIFLFKIKNFFPDIYIVAVQNGIRTKPYFENLKNEKNLQCDYILTWGSKIADIYKKYIKCKTLIIGSFLNNKYKKNLNPHRKKNIVLIAPKFHKENEIKYISKPNIFISAKNFYKKDRIMLPKLYAIAKKLNKKFEIISKNNGKIYEFEKKFYEKLLNTKNFKLHYHRKSNSAYKISDQAELCINTTSSFGLECLARGNKICFLNYKNKDKILKYLDIFWPLKIKKDGDFWTNTTKNKKLEKVLKHTIYTKKNTWKKKTKMLFHNAISYDKENRIFQNLIKRLSK